ncbi:MAG: alpha-2-macroglobulin [Syntrophobacteraceae bacterium]|nr:alpha-2-macroglobulin [Syntrophobacteraceae bacterium]
MELLKVIVWPFRLLGSGILFVFRALLGSFSWDPPAWLRYLGGSLQPIGRRAKGNRPAAALLSLVLLILVGGVGGGAYWYKHRPKPVETRFKVIAPALTTREDSKTKVSPCVIQFFSSAAPLAMIGKPVVHGIEIFPQIEGAWRWTSDRELRFMPKADWPVGQQFRVTMAKKGLVAQHIRLSGYAFKFNTAGFSANISEAQFYQDPVNPDIKKVEATVTFSHPVEPSQFEKRVRLLMAVGKGKVATEPAKYGFTITYDKLKLHGYIHSAPVGIPEKASAMRVIVAPGVRAAAGGPPTGAGVEKLVNIPGLYSNLRITSAILTLVKNERSEPEQVMIVTTSVPTLRKEIKKSVSAFVLPEFGPPSEKSARKKPFDWTGPEVRIDSETLKGSQPLKLAQLPNEKEFGTVFSFKLNADVGRFVSIHVAKGMKSFGGYILASNCETTVKVPPYPSELKILAEGSLLSLSGEKKISILSRDNPAVLFEVGRVLPDQMQQLVSQNSGSFSKPGLDSCIGPDDISERFTEVRRLPDPGPGKARYEAFDFSKYLGNGGEARRGCFLFTAQGYDPVKQSARGQRDSRFILVTDLGLLVKDNVDGTHDLFVQSIHDGGPVADAIVKVVGKNGLAVLSDTTGADGHVHFPGLSDFQREKTPVMYLVEKSGDMSFLPVSREDRRLNMSRFDVGGVANALEPDRLNAYLFSDRGVYRPGDEFRIGMIVKSGDWKGDLAGIPLEAAITDARGLVVARKKLKLTAAGFEEMRYATQDSSPTGTYTVNLYVVKDSEPKGLLGSTTVQVQEFLPDRMKIAVHLSAESPDGWVSPDKLKGLVTLRNLFGTPATGRMVSATLNLDPASPRFKKFKDFHFFDPNRAKQGYQEDLENGKTDEKGEASFDFNLGRFANATYLLRFGAEGFEAEGGRGVGGQASVLVSPDSYLIGYKADGNLKYIDKGADRSVELLAIDPRVDRTAAPDLKLVLVSCKYVSVLTRQKSGLYKYQSVKKEETLKEEPVSIPAEGLRRTLSTSEPGDFALLIKDARGTELNRIEYTVAGQGNIARSLEKNAELQLSLNKTDCVPGEEIEVSIRAPYTGAGLITVERDKVYSFQWFKADTNNTVQKVRIPEGLEGNGYISVAFIRDINSKEIFMSPLSYGAVPFSVSVEKRRAKVTVTCDELAKPGMPYTIRYKTDRPARVVLFAVDAGILQVARYKTPDPLGYFFQKRELGVKTSQILDQILPEFSRLMEVSSAGGGEENEETASHLNPFKRKHEAPVAFWSGILDSDATEREIVFPVPDYFNGTMKVMAVAVSPDAIGTFEKDAVIRGDFVLSPNVPTFVAPGDEFDVSVSVANNVKGSGNGPRVCVGLKTSENLEIVGKSSVDLTIGEMREASARFRLRAKHLLGAAKLKFTASMGDKSGGYATEISVRPPVPYRTSLQAGFFRNGKQDVTVARNLYPQFRTLRAGISNLPLGLAHGLLGYLEKYPYGCTEQLVSQAMPAIVLYNRPEFGFAPERSEKTLSKIIGILRTRQNGDGAFGLWAANSEVSDFASVYAVQFLLEAKERNFPVPADMIASGMHYLRQLGASEGQDLSGERVRAYAVYLMTRNGINTSNYIASLQNRLEARYPKVWKTDLAGIYMAATYKMLKQDSLADKLIALSRPGEVVRPDYDHYYDTMIRDAQLLTIVARHFPDRLERLGGQDILALLKPLQAGAFNTLSSAYAILALDTYANAVKTGPASKFTLSEILSGEEAKPLALPQGLFPQANFSSNAVKIRFSSDGPLDAFYMVMQSGFDKTAPKEAISNGFEVEREYTDTLGKPIGKVKLGSEIEVHLKLRATGAAVIGRLALVDLLPGGFEVVLNPSRSASQSSQWTPSFGLAKSTWRPDYADAREDRVVLYGSADSKAREFVYRIKAVNSGTFAVPPAFGESMYDRSVQASSPGGKIEVVE